MARLCPQCGEIHFETTTAPMPERCRKCEADLNGAAGLMPSLHAESVDTPPPVAPVTASSPGVKALITGGVLLAFAGVALYFGYDWHSRVKPATATVHEVSADTPKWAKRDKLTATYSVGSKSYPQYPGVRMENTTFTVYYLPEAPDTGYETKPFIWLVIGGKVFMWGLGIFTFGVYRFLVGRAQAADHRKVMARAG